MLEGGGAGTPSRHAGSQSADRGREGSRSHWLLHLVPISDDPALGTEHSLTRCVYTALSRAHKEAHYAVWQEAWGCGFLHKAGRFVWTSGLPLCCRFTPASAPCSRGRLQPFPAARAGLELGAGLAHPSAS